MSGSNIRHVSIRVPWHDRGWDGHVCNEPLGNSACLALKLIADNRKDVQENLYHGKSFEALELEGVDVPPCLGTSATFLSRRAHTLKVVMAYSKWSRDHRHILPRTLHLPAWGAIIIPYRWMLRKSGFDIAEELELDVQKEREPSEPQWLTRTSWIQSSTNQELLLNSFGAPLKEEQSLVFFYATRTPLVDDARRVILGAAVLQKKHNIVEYKYNDSSSPLKAMVWERPIQHTLRASRKGGFDGGFVMPYHSILELANLRPEIDPKDFIAFTPDDARIQFSYGSEHVTSGIAAATLLSARGVLEHTASVLDGPWTRYISWIDDQLSALWKMQGPAPGLGPVLSALHPGFNGTLFAMALADELKPNSDPWPVVNEIFTDKRQAPPGSPSITAMFRRRWAKLRDNKNKFEATRLIARFELTKEQAVRALDFEPDRLLSNPYLLFELDRVSYAPIPFAAIDRGLYPGREIAIKHPLTTALNTELTEHDNPLRLRAACAEILESAARREGHTWLPASQIEKACPMLAANQPVHLDNELIELCRDEFKPLVKVINHGTELAVQLDRYVSSGAMIKSAIDNRLKQRFKKVSIPWMELVDKKFGQQRKEHPQEIRARKEKADALQKLAESRIGVLIGPAGTGKTTILQLLISHPEIVGKRVRLLAPTGKARVRLGQESERPADVETVAKFLLDAQRYDTKTGRYFPNKDAGKIEATTCVVDECSMLTEEMLAALVDAIPDSCRLILAGDPYQLPPIGAGSPFVDIIEYLQHSGERALVELNTQMRQEQPSGRGAASALARSDVQLAAIFSGRDLPPGEDEIVLKALAGEDDDHVKYRRWDTITDLTKCVRDALSAELGNRTDEFISSFEKSLGARINSKGYLEFDRNCSDVLSNWQILCATRNTPGGSVFINRSVKEELRATRLEKAVDSNRVPHYKDWMRFTKPRGPEQIVYGDKVICVRNHNREFWKYSGGNQDEKKDFLANGEIGIVNGQRSYGKRNPLFTQVEFSGRADRNFSFGPWDFSEDGIPYLELAYAITVHKAQGSEFETVLLVLPSNSRLISREMIYTALTRQKERIWILHQGPFDRVLSYRYYVFSDIAARMTNLLRTPVIQATRLPSGLPPDIPTRRRDFLQEKLIHRTRRGDMVSSKSELAIANILFELEREGYLTYIQEPLLPFDDARGRWADFRIDAQGQTWYWEHCGMLENEHYVKRWNLKKKLYQANGYGVYSKQNPKGRLILSEDGSKTGLDSAAIEELARHLFVP
jgi:ATP-dependent exoDNAse (exonuclease V) alpha subunit